jgi:hypothetical protein
VAFDGEAVNSRLGFTNQPFPAWRCGARFRVTIPSATDFA